MLDATQNSLFISNSSTLKIEKGERMKRILKFSLIGFLAVTLFSCDFNDDDYSLNDRWVGFGIIDVGSGSDYTIQMDDGSELIPVNSYYNWDEDEDSTRVFVNFTILDDKLIDDEHEEYYVQVNQVQKILFKGILDITEEIEDSIGNDPVHVESVWTTNNMLTFELDYYGGYNSGVVHYINLVKQPGVPTADDEPIELELRHNDNDDQPSYHMTALVTFDLSSLKIAGQDSVNFKVTGKDYDGDVFEHEGTYKY